MIVLAPLGLFLHLGLLFSYSGLLHLLFHFLLLRPLLLLLPGNDFPRPNLPHLSLRPARRVIGRSLPIHDASEEGGFSGVGVLAGDAGGARVAVDLGHVFLLVHGHDHALVRDERFKVFASVSEGHLVARLGFSCCFLCCGRSEGKVCVCVVARDKKLFMFIYERAGAFLALLLVAKGAASKYKCIKDERLCVFCINQ
ncbi:MAG: hypothetical protein BYD32DRAFT_289204 [Podila humilis]|nr:MAG: hypothetical protein BYD32DRAFT_289204 [Podila humilis]